MSESYVECIIESKTNPMLSFVKYLLISITVVLGLFGFFGGYAIVLFGALLTGVGAYFASPYSSLEYEYLYLDKEIVVDKIFNKSKRKRFATYELDKIEIMAPINSWHLDQYKNRQFKLEDISSKEAKQPDNRFVFFYDGQKKVIFEPSQEMVKVMRSVAPRKILVD